MCNKVVIHFIVNKQLSMIVREASGSSKKEWAMVRSTRKPFSCAILIMRTTPIDMQIFKGIYWILYSNVAYWFTYIWLAGKSPLLAGSPISGWLCKCLRPVWCPHDPSVEQIDIWALPFTPSRTAAQSWAGFQLMQVDGCSKPVVFFSAGNGYPGFKWDTASVPCSETSSQWDEPQAGHKWSQQSRCPWEIRACQSPWEVQKCHMAM